MGLMNFISKQFIDVIQWTEEESGVLAYRYPMADMEIQNGGQLIVREAQQAAFFNEGKFADKFSAGTFTLTTQNLPILTNLKNWDKFFESPFKSDVYFFSMREQIDQKWGTTQPITIRDKEYGPLRIRAFGNYSYKIADIENFWLKLCGTSEKYTVADVEGQLRAAVLTALATCLGGAEVPFIDMAANQGLLSEKLKEAVAPALADYGLELRNFYLQSLSLPEELEKHLDRATSMRMVGNLQQYGQFQTADAIGVAAENSGGVAGAGAGLGAGLAMGQMMMQNLGTGNASAPAAAAPVALSADDAIATLEKLGALVTKGILTQAEFDAKKAEILSKI